VNEENQYREMILDTDSHGNNKTMLSKQPIYPVNATVRNLRNRTTIGDMPTNVHLRNKSPSGMFDNGGSRITETSPIKGKKLQLNVASGHTSGQFNHDKNGIISGSNTARKLQSIGIGKNFS
jgi:hypothetical protein